MFHVMTWSLAFASFFFNEDIKAKQQCMFALYFWKEDEGQIFSKYD